MACLLCRPREHGTVLRRDDHTPFSVYRKLVGMLPQISRTHQADDIVCGKNENHTSAFGHKPRHILRPLASMADFSTAFCHTYKAWTANKDIWGMEPYPHGSCVVRLDVHTASNARSRICMAVVLFHTAVVDVVQFYRNCNQFLRILLPDKHRMHLCDTARDRHGCHISAFDRTAWYRYVRLRCRSQELEGHRVVSVCV